MESIAIFGAGGHGREVLMLIDQINAYEEQWHVEGFFDDNVAPGTIVDGIPVIGGLEKLNRHERRLAVAMGIGAPAIKKKLLGSVANGHLWFPTLIHPSVQAPLRRQAAKFGAGAIVFGHAEIGPHVEIGDHALVHMGVIIGHGSRLNDYASVMPGVVIAGDVIVGAGSYIGVGASIINKVEIGENTTVGAGSVVFNSLPSHCTAMGMPARPVRRHDTEARIAGS